jgi:hypothetical protein
MDLSFPFTFAIIAAAVALFAYAWWRHRQPADLLKIRLINYGLVQLFCVFVILIMGAHLVTLFVGHPVTGQGQGTP